MIKTVFLDLDDTVLDFGRGERHALIGAFKKLNIPCDDRTIDRYVEINLDCWRALERGELTLNEVLYGRFEKLFSEIKISASVEETQNTYQELLSHEHDFMPGGKELLDALRDSGKYRLFMATNGSPDVQYPRIADSGVGEYYEKIFISYELGVAKPKREFFEKCFAEIEGFKREEAIIVGDSLSSDIKGGINAGIKTCHFNHRGREYTDIIPDYTIKDLSELIPLLDSIE